MEPMGATMGLAFPAFAGAWALMMTVMMLPSAIPVALRYARMFGPRREVRLALFSAGYVGIWAASGLPTYALMLLVHRVASMGATAATATASVLLAAYGGYQLTALKDRCLRACRAPMGLLLRYAGWRGRLRDLRVGVHHGAICLACCWALVALLAVFGVMSIAAMVVLAGIVAVEKLAPGGHRFAHGLGVAAMALAVAVWWAPALTPGLHLIETM